MRPGVDEEGFGHVNYSGTKYQEQLDSYKAEVCDTLEKFSTDVDAIRDLCTRLPPLINRINESLTRDEKHRDFLLARVSPCHIEMKRSLGIYRVGNPYENSYNVNFMANSTLNSTFFR